MSGIKKCALMSVIALCVANTLTAQGLDAIFMSKKYASLEEGLRMSAKKQALYAFNIANLSTPGFVPILTPEDQSILRDVSPSQEKSKEVLLEFLMSRMAENSKKYNALLALWKLKIDNNKRIVTLGK